MIIPDHIIADIQNNCNIVEVISETVALKKAGMNYVGLCPFHSEKTPSFSVSPDKQMFYCFGCGVGGNVFTFLMKHDGISFTDSVQTLADRRGIQVPDTMYSGEHLQRKSERENLLTINRQAMEFFETRLKDASGESAIKYLTGRGVHRDIIERFHLGFAPDGWDHLTKHLTQQRISLEHAEKAGLIARKNKPGYYDRFRNRVIFPIMNVRGDPIGFGGRVMDDSLPKYLNSPETLLYNKSRSLYGLNLSRVRSRETGCVYVVEGYFDLISMHRHGFENTAATLGTALTSDHVRLLKGYCQQVIMVYDSDTAGIGAAQRSIGIFRKEGMEARFLILPDGQDPDSFLLKFGADAFTKASSGALSPVAFLLECGIRKHGLSTEGKIRIIDDLVEPLSSVRDNLAISLYVREIAERVGVEEHMILERIRSAVSGNTERQNMIPKRSAETEPNTMERRIISMMLQYPEMIPEIRRRNCLDFFQDTSLKTIGTSILTQKNVSGNYIHDLINAIPDENQKNMALSLAIGSQVTDSGNIWNTDGCILLLEQFESGRNRPFSQLSKDVKTAEESNNPHLMQKTLENMNQRLKDIKEKQLQRRIQKSGDR